MAEPTRKNPAIRDMQSTIMGCDVPAMIKADRCVSCKGVAVEFKDEVSRKDYAITGLCQACQDAVYNATED